MHLIDLSQPITDGGPNCPVHPPISIRTVATHPADGWHMELMTLATHTGSHIDAPLHKVPGGASISDLPLDRFVGPAVIADLRGITAAAAIDAAQLEKHLPSLAPDTIVLLATGWGERRARTDEWLTESPFLAPSGAQWLVEHRARAVGIDHYSIGGSREPGNAATHEVLLGGGLWIVEELRFPPAIFTVTQPFTFWALPINLPGSSGAFCRPVAAIG